MSRPRLTRAQLNNRKRVGQILRDLRIEADLSVREAARAANVQWTRLAQIEAGKRPYESVFARVALSYGKTPEEVIRRASGQLSLDLLAAIIGPAPSEKRDARLNSKLTVEERDMLESFLGWMRLRKRLSASTARQNPNFAGRN
jgi:transcriptional regulator with XRE-family HTH domain